MKAIATTLAAALALAISATGASASSPNTTGTAQGSSAAASYGTIVGTALEVNASGTTREPYAAVWLYQWNGSQWVSLGQRATTNSSGNYSISGVQLGYYYQVAAVKNYGMCGIGTGLAHYVGWSAVFLDNVSQAIDRGHFSCALMLSTWRA